MIQSIMTSQPSEAYMFEQIFPGDTNYLGTAFGGYILGLMDKVASIAAVRHCKNNVVTARMDTVEFHIPIRVGDGVELKAKVSRVGRTSMTIHVDVFKETLTTGEQTLATSGDFVFVAIGADGKPTAVPPLAYVG